ncbi:MAG: flagellar assembly protein FliW [Nitrospirae bacterium]|nr:flagellar assembly protein FliW [Nitrospirota bacterium]
MIKFGTARFGDLEVREEKIITFPEGIVGLPDLKKFILIDHKDTPLKWLQSLDDPDMAFIVASPEFVAAEFQINLDKTVREYIELENDDDLVVLVIMRVSGEDVIANFQGPLIVNVSNMRGVQIILDSPDKFSRKGG